MSHLQIASLNCVSQAAPDPGTESLGELAIFLEQLWFDLRQWNLLDTHILGCRMLSRIEFIVAGRAEDWVRLREWNKLGAFGEVEEGCAPSRTTVNDSLENFGDEAHDCRCL